MRQRPWHGIRCREESGETVVGEGGRISPFHGLRFVIHLDPWQEKTSKLFQVAIHALASPCFFARLWTPKAHQGPLGSDTPASASPPLSPGGQGRVTAMALGLPSKPVTNQSTSMDQHFYGWILRCLPLGRKPGYKSGQALTCFLLGGSTPASTKAQS